MRKSLAILGGALLASGLSACGGGGLFDRDRPDEFAVSRNAPLVIPPDYALEPPQPGAAPVQGSTDQEQVLDALFGGPAPRSAVERAVNQQAGEADLAVAFEESKAQRVFDGALNQFPGYPSRPVAPHQEGVD